MSITCLLLALTGLPDAGNGELLRLAGDRQTEFWVAAVYPCVIDFDGDGLFDLVASDRYGTGAVVTWFRNVGQPCAPRFSEREAVPLCTGDGRAISNPNRGWLLTAAVCDWDGDGTLDLLCGTYTRGRIYFLRPPAATPQGFPSSPNRSRWRRAERRLISSCTASRRSATGTATATAA